MSELVDKKKKILLCVTGLSPQVVTETLYVLAVKQDWLPDEIHLITTMEGAKRAKLSLLSEDPGWFHALRRDYQLPEINFSEQTIHVLENEAGQPMADIRTPLDNEMAANFIVEHVRKLTADPVSELHVSIAGGRKTMGFYLGYALTLFGRPQDRLSHVLVESPYESCWEFFYPTPYSRIFETRDRSLIDSRDAELTLAGIPFVTLRHGLTDDLLGGRVSFAGAVEELNRALSPPELVIDLAEGLLSAGGKPVRVHPVSLAMLALFARRCMQGKGPLRAPNKDVPEKEWAELFLSEYRQIKGEFADTDETERALRNGMDGSYFSSKKSRLHRQLREALGAASSHYEIDDGGRRPRLYGLKLPAAAIRFEKIAP